jgi:hypothetical protein
MRFRYPFFISFDRFEGRNMAGSGLFFILMTFSCLNFKKLCFFMWRDQNMWRTLQNSVVAVRHITLLCCCSMWCDATTMIIHVAHHYNLCALVVAMCYIF